MLPSTCVVVPTYWTRAGGAARPDDAVYDHPTTLDGPETLSALLDSLDELDTDSFYLLVLVAVTGNDVADEAEQRVAALVARHPSLVSLVFGPSQLRDVQQRVADRISDDAADYLQLRQYPRIRNLQLALPHVLETAAIVGLDDDEIVVDRDFVARAVEPLGTRLRGKRVDGLSGYYLQEDGSILLKMSAQAAKSPNIFDRKAAIMNAATEAAEADPDPIVETSFCFGGNMEFSADLAATVGFDPNITRGEDIDYLINARMEGRHFFLRKDLRILHCPPSGGSYKDVTRSKLEQDVIRFLYERAKLEASTVTPELQPVRAEELSAYPGDFLRDDIAPDAVGALARAGYGDDAAGFVAQVQEDNARRVQQYLQFRRVWPSMQEALRQGPEVRDGLLRRVRGL